MDVQYLQIPLERFLQYEVNYLLKLFGSNTGNQIASILQLCCKINNNIITTVFGVESAVSMITTQH